MTAGLAALAWLVAQAAPGDELWSRCADSDTAQAIAGCTALIKAKGLSSADLAIAHYDLANALAASAQLARGQRNGDAAAKRFVASALVHFDNALRRDPTLTAALVNRGALHFREGRLVDAEADTSRAIDLRPDLAEAWNNRALTRLRMGRYDEAKADFDQTIRLSQNFGNALIIRVLGPLRP